MRIKVFYLALESDFPWSHEEDEILHDLGHFNSMLRICNNSRIN